MKKVCERDDCLVSFETKDTRKRYCTRSCAAIVNNTLYPKRYRLGNEHCLQCNGKLWQYQKAFCSRECNLSHKREKYIRDWLSGKNNGSQANGSISSTVRKYLIVEANYRCQSPECAVPGGWSVPNPVTGKPILTVDHIDGNWKNNTVDNLIVLCYSCHTLTPTFGSLNTGNGAGSRGSGNRMYPNGPLV